MVNVSRGSAHGKSNDFILDVEGRRIIDVVGCVVHIHLIFPRCLLDSGQADEKPEIGPVQRAIAIPLTGDTYDVPLRWMCSCPCLLRLR